MPLDSKHTEASFLPTLTNSLYLRITQVPRCQDLVIYCGRRWQQQHDQLLYPCSCTQGKSAHNYYMWWHNMLHDIIICHIHAHMCVCVCVWSAILLHTKKVTSLRCPIIAISFGLLEFGGGGCHLQLWVKTVYASAVHNVHERNAPTENVSGVSYTHVTSYYALCMYNLFICTTDLVCVCKGRRCICPSL